MLGIITGGAEICVVTLGEVAQATVGRAINIGADVLGVQAPEPEGHE